MRNKHAITPSYGMALIALLMIFAFGCTNISGSEVESKKSALSENEMETSVETTWSAPSATSSDAGISKDSGIQDSGTDPQMDGGTELLKLFSDESVDVEPDSREAFFYNNHKDAEITKNIRAATINHEAFRSPALILNIFGEKGLVIYRDDFREKSYSHFTWHGKPADSDDWALFVVIGQDVEGMIQIEEDIYLVKSLGKGLSAIIERDESKAGYDDPNDYGIIGDLSEKEEEKTEGDTKQTDPIRMLIAYTTAAANHENNMQAAALIEIMNFIYAHQDSGVTHEVELARVVEVNYTESDAGCLPDGGSAPLGERGIDIDLERFMGTNDAYMNEIHNMRSRYDADICVLVRYCPAGNSCCGSSCCGCGTSACASPPDLGANASTAFAVTSSLCGYNMQHEVGHLYGCRHQYENDPDGDAEHGYCRNFLIPYFRTLMTVTTENCTSSITKIRRWSNPDKTYYGYATGVDEESECYDKINDSANAVSNFKTTDDTVSLSSEAIDEYEYASALASDQITSSSYTVEDNATVYFTAPTIKLQTGFHAKSGSHFKASQ